MASAHPDPSVLLSPRPSAAPARTFFQPPSNSSCVQKDATLRSLTDLSAWKVRVSSPSQIISPRDQRRLQLAAARPKIDLSLKSQAAQLFRTVQAGISRIATQSGAASASDASSDGADPHHDPEAAHAASAHVELLLSLDSIRDSDSALHGLMHRHFSMKRAVSHSGVYGQDPRLPPSHTGANESSSSSSRSTARRPSTRRRQRQEDLSRFPFARQLQLLAESAKRCTSLVSQAQADPELRAMLSLHLALKAHEPSIAEQQLRLGADTCALCPSTEIGILSQLHGLLDTLSSFIASRAQHTDIKSDWMETTSGLNPAALSTPENPQKYIESVACDSRYPSALRSMALASAQLLAAAAAVAAECPRGQSRRSSHALSEDALTAAVAECYAATFSFFDAAQTLEFAADCRPLQQVVDHLSLAPSMFSQLLASFLKSNDAGCSLEEAFGGYFQSSTLATPNAEGGAAQIEEALDLCNTAGFPSILCLAVLRQLLLLRRQALLLQTRPGASLHRCSSNCSTALQMMRLTLSFVRSVGIVSVAGLDSDQRASESSQAAFAASSVDIDSESDSDVASRADLPQAAEGKQGKPTPVLASMSPTLTPMLTASASQSGDFSKTVASTATMPTVCIGLRPPSPMASRGDALPAMDLGAPAVGLGPQNSNSTLHCDFSDVDGFLQTILCTLQLVLDDTDYATGWTLQRETGASDKTSAALATLHAQVRDVRLAPGGIASTDAKLTSIPFALQLDAQQLDAALSGAAVGSSGSSLPRSAESQGTPLMASVKAAAQIVSLKAEGSDDEARDGFVVSRLPSSSASIDSGTALDSLLSWQLVFQRACAKTQTTLVEALRSSSGDCLAAWTHSSMALHSTPLSIHGLVLKAVSVLRSVMGVSEASSRTILSPEAPFVLQQSLAVVNSCASTEVASQVLVSELPLSCHLDQTARAGDLLGALWTGVKAEDATILEMLHSCMQWERTNAGTDPLKLHCCGDLLLALEQRLARPWLRLPEAPTGTSPSIKQASAEGDQSPHAMPSAEALSVLEQKVDISSASSPNALLAESWVAVKPVGLHLPTTQSRVTAEALLWDSARSGESVTIAANGSVASQRMPRSWGSAIGLKGFAPGTGVHKFDIKIKRCTSSNMFIGVTTREASSSTFVGGDAHGWGMSSQGHSWHNRARQGYGGGAGRRFYPGTIVRVTVNTVTGEVSFGSPTRPWGITIHNAGHDSNGRMRELFPAVSMYSRGDEVRLRAVQDSPNAANNRVDLTKSLLGLNYDKTRLHKFISREDLSLYAMAGWRSGSENRHKQRLPASSAEGLTGQTWLPPALSVQLAAEAAADTLCADELNVVEQLSGSPLLLKTLELRCEALSQQLQLAADPSDKVLQQQAVESSRLLSSIEYFLPDLFDPAWTESLCRTVEKLRSSIATVLAGRPLVLRASHLGGFVHDMSATWQVCAEDKNGSSPHAFCVSIQQGVAGDLVGCASLDLLTLSAEGGDRYGNLAGLVSGKVSGNALELTISWNDSSEYDEGGANSRSNSSLPVQYFSGCISADGSAAWMMKRDSKDDTKTERAFMSYLCPNKGSCPRTSLGVVEQVDFWDCLQTLHRSCVACLGAACCSQLTAPAVIESSVGRPLFASLWVSQAEPTEPAATTEPLSDHQACSFDELTRYGLASFAELFADAAGDSFTATFLDEMVGFSPTRQHLSRVTDLLRTVPLPLIQRFLENAKQFLIDPLVAGVLRRVGSAGSQSRVAAAAPSSAEAESKAEEDGPSGSLSPGSSSDAAASHKALQVCMHFCRSPAAAAGLLPELSDALAGMVFADGRPMPQSKVSSIVPKCQVNPLAVFLCSAECHSETQGHVWATFHSNMCQVVMKGFANRITRRHLEFPEMKNFVSAFVGALLHHQGLAELAACAADDEALLCKVRDNVLAQAWRQAMVCALELRKTVLKSKSAESTASALSESLRSAASNCEALLLFASATRQRSAPVSDDEVDISKAFESFLEKASSTQDSTAVPHAVEHFWHVDLIPAMFAFCSSPEDDLAFQLLTTATSQTLRQHIRHASVVRIQQLLADSTSSKDWSRGVPDWLEPLLYHTCWCTTGHALTAGDVSPNAGFASNLGSLFVASSTHSEIVSALADLRLSYVSVMRHLTAVSLVELPESVGWSARRHFAWPNAWECVSYLLMAFCIQQDLPSVAAAHPKSWSDDFLFLGSSRNSASSQRLHVTAISSALVWAQGLQASWVGHQQSAIACCGIMEELWSDTPFECVSSPCRISLESSRANFLSMLQDAKSCQSVVTPDSAGVLVLQGHIDELVRVSAVRVLTDQCEQIACCSARQTFTPDAGAVSKTAAAQVLESQNVASGDVEARISTPLKPLAVVAAALFKEVTRCKQAFRVLECRSAYAESVEKPDEIRDAWTEYKRVGYAAGALLPRPNAAGQAVISDLKSCAVEATLTSLTASTAEWSLYKVLLSLLSVVSSPGVRGVLSRPEWLTVFWGCATCWTAPARLRQRAMQLLRSCVTHSSPSVVDKCFEFACGTGSRQGAREEAQRRLNSNPDVSTHSQHADGMPNGIFAVQKLLDMIGRISQLPLLSATASPPSSDTASTSASKAARQGSSGLPAVQAAESPGAVGNDVWTDFVSSLTGDFLPIVRRAVRQSDSSTLVGSQRSAAQLGTVAQCVALLRQLAGMSAWRPAVLQLFQTALQGLAELGSKPTGNELPDESEAAPVKAEYSPTNEILQLCVDDAVQTKAARGLAVLAVMGGFKDVLRPGVIARQVACSAWDLPGEDKLPTTALDRKHGHVLYGRAPLWGASCVEESTPQKPTTSPAAPLQHLLRESVNHFAVASSDHVLGTLAAVQVGSGCRLFKLVSHLHASLQSSVISAARDMHPGPPLFAGGDVCEPIGWEDVSASHRDEEIAEKVAGAFTAFSGLRPRSKEAAAFATQRTAFQKLCMLVRGPGAKVSTLGNHQQASSWQAMLCCIGAVLSRTKTSEKLELGRVVCIPRTECLLPQVQSPPLLGNFTYAGSAGVDAQHDLPPPQLGLGIIANVDSNAREGSDFLRSGAKCLVAARSGGPNSYLVSLPARLLAVENEIAADPADFPPELVQHLSLSLLPCLLEHYLTHASGEGQLDSPKPSTSVKRRARSPAQKERLSLTSTSGSSGIDVELLHSSLRVNVLRTLSVLLRHPAHSDQVQRDISSQIYSSQSKQPASLLAMLLSLARLSDQNITAHSLHIAEQGHSTLGLLLAAKHQQQQDERGERIQAHMDQTGRMPAAQDSVSLGQRSSVSETSAELSLPRQKSKQRSCNLVKALSTGVLPAPDHDAGFLSLCAELNLLCPPRLNRLQLEADSSSSATGGEQIPSSTQRALELAQGASAVTPTGARRVVAQTNMYGSASEDAHGSSNSDTDADDDDDDDDDDSMDDALDHEKAEGAFGDDFSDSQDDDSAGGEGDEDGDDFGFAGDLFAMGGSSSLSVGADAFMDVVRRMTGRSPAIEQAASSAEHSLSRAVSGGSSASAVAERLNAAASRSAESSLARRAGPASAANEDAGAAAAASGAGDDASGEPSAECSMMMDMGFKREWCELALRRTGRNVEMACNFIFENMPVMDTLVDALQERHRSLAASSDSAPADTRLIAEVANSLQELGFPEDWAERCVKRSKATALQDALAWAVANFESLQREDAVSASDSIASAEPANADEPQSAVKLAYTPGAKPSSPFSSEEAQGLPSRLCTVLNGSLSVSGSLLVSASRRPMMHDSTFPTMRLSPLRITSGKWYFEVVVEASGYLQIGWCDEMFSGNAFGGLGVGDDKHSWAWDGRRSKLWHDGSTDWGKKWSAGDVVCCCIDMDKAMMFWGLNGSYSAPMGLGFAGFRNHGAIFPAITVQSGTKCQLRLGEPNRPFLCGPPPGFRPMLEAALSNQHLPREEPHAARRCPCPLDHSPDQMLCSNHALEKNREAVAGEGGAVYSASGAWRKRHFSSGRVGSTAKVLSGAVGVGGGMRRSKNSPISADSGPVRTAAIRIAPGLSYTGSSNTELASIMKLSAMELRRAHINLSASLSVAYAREILVTMLALFQPSDPTASQPILSIVDMLEQSGGSDMARLFSILTCWMSWTSISMLPVSIAKLAESAAHAPLYRAALEHLATQSPQHHWDLHVENPINAQGISAAVQHVVTSSSHNFAGAAGTELARLPNGVNLCAVVEPALLSAILQRTFKEPAGLYSKKSLSPVLKSLLRQLKSSLVNPPAGGTRWPSQKAPGSDFEPPAVAGAWNGGFVRQKHNLGGIQWLFSLLMAVALRQRACSPNVAESKPLGTVFSGKKKTISGAMGPTDVYQKDEQVLLNFSRELARFEQTSTKRGGFMSYSVTIELFSALCAAARSGSDAFKTVVFGLLAGLCAELLQDLLACEAQLLESGSMGNDPHVGTCLIEVLEAHTSLWTTECLEVWLAVRLEGERAAEIGSLVVGAAAELHSSMFALQSNIQRLRAKWLGAEHASHIAAALASSIDAPQPSQVDCSETKEEEDAPLGDAGGGSAQPLAEVTDSLTNEHEASVVVQASILRTDVDDGLPGRTQHAAFLPAPASDSESNYKPWRSIACGAGEALGPGAQGVCAPGFVCKNAQSGELELTTGVHQWTGSMELHAPTSEPFLRWGQTLPFKSGLRPGMTFEVVKAMPELPDIGTQGRVQSISYSEEAGVLLDLTWAAEGDVATKRFSFVSDFDALTKSIAVYEGEADAKRLVSFAQPSVFAVEPEWAANHNVPCPQLTPSVCGDTAPTAIGNDGVIVRLSIVPHEPEAPHGVANTVALRSFSVEQQDGPLKRLKGLRIAGSIELPEYGGAIVGVSGYWVLSETAAAETGRKVARFDGTSGPRPTSQSDAGAEDGLPLASAWRIELEEVELLAGHSEKGWHRRFGHDWYVPGTKWFSNYVDEPTFVRHEPLEGSGPSMVSVRWPRNLTFGSDVHFSANGKKSFNTSVLNLQSQFLFCWDSAAVGRGVKTNAVHTVVQGTPGMGSRCLALGNVGFSRGVHYWEVQIVRALEPGTILIGVAEKKEFGEQSLEHSLSTWSDNCWGITTNRLLVHPGLQQPFGETLNPGDIVGVRLDADQGKLNFFLDGMQFGEHLIRDLGEAFDSLRAPNCTANTPRVLYPCIGLRHFSDCVRLLPAHFSQPRTSHGIGLLGSCSVSRPRLLLGASPLLATQERERSDRGGAISVGSRVLDTEVFSSILRNWERPGAFMRAHSYLVDTEQALLHAPTAAGVKRRRADADGVSSASRTPAGQDLACSVLDAEAESVVKFCVSIWSRVSALQAGSHRLYPTRAGLHVSLDRAQESLDRLLAAHEHDLPLRIDDVLDLNFSYERELQAPEKVQLLGTRGDHVWYRLVSPPQGSDGAAQGFKLAWCLPHSILHLMSGRPIDEFVQRRSDSSESLSTKTLAVHGLLRSPASFAACLAWSTQPDPKQRSLADKWLVTATNQLCNKIDVNPEQLLPSQVASALEQFPDKPTAILAEGELDVSFATGRAFALIELSLLSERVLPWLPMGHQHEPGARSVAADIVSAVSATQAHASLSRHLARPTPGTIAAADHPMMWRPSTLSGRVRHLRALLLNRSKLRLWQAALHTTTHPTMPSIEAFEDPRDIQTLRISRGPKTKPERLANVAKPETRLRTSITGQLMEAVSQLSDSSLRRSYVGKGHGGQPRAFLVKLLGEGADDYGGPYRALFESVADELQADAVRVVDGSSSLLPVFTPCSNRHFATDTGTAQHFPAAEAFQPSEEQLASSIYGREAFAFVGRLAGMAMRHGINMPIALVPHVLKQLVRSPLQAADAELANSGVSLPRLLPDGFDEVPDPDDTDRRASFNAALKAAGRTFLVEVVPGVERELVHRGSLVAVTADNFSLYAALAQAASLSYARDQVASLAQGLSAVVPYDLLTIWSPLELDELLGGKADVSVASLKAMTEYSDGLRGDEQHIQWMWQVLEEGQPNDRIAFLRFVAARSRLPSSIQFLPTGLSVSSPEAEKEGELPLPEAKTCFVTLSLPRYRSKAELRSKLLLAIHHSPNMDADVLLHNAEGWADV